MSENELLEVRNWLQERAKEVAGDKDPTESESHPLACVIVDMVNEEIKDNILELKVDAEDGDDTTFGDYIRNGLKIHAIKVVRGLFKWGLLESKNFCDSNWDKWLAKVKA